MVCLIHQYQLEIIGIEFHHPIPRDKTPDRRHRDVCATRCMQVSHLNIDGLRRVGIRAMASRLFHQFAAVDKYEGLRRIVGRRLDSVDELGEDDLPVGSEQLSSDRIRPTVLPLPVASDMPSLLCPCSREVRIDCMHSSWYWRRRMAGVGAVSRAFEETVASHRCGLQSLV